MCICSRENSRSNKWTFLYFSMLAGPEQGKKQLNFGKDLTHIFSMQKKKIILKFKGLVSNVFSMTFGF